MMLILILLSITEIVKSTKFTDPVRTAQGLIRGLVAEDGNYSMYLGVPYAKVNEANPFGASVPYTQFDGIFDAVDENIACPQREEYNHTIIGTLDCLTLNIYVPNKFSLETKLPVQAYVYGGRFSYGFSKRYIYDPKFLVKHDIIFVIFNYRVGPYGFMCLDTKDIPGNQGLKDQYSALKWIYQNIASFGGDVNRITLSGNSAGAMSVDLHLLSKLPKFYQQAMLQSGTALNPGLILPSDVAVPFKIAEHLGFRTQDMQEAISFLSNTDTNLVISATVELGLIFRPCVEKEFHNVVRFIDTHPEHQNISNINNIKILAGYNSKEENMHYNIYEDMFSDNIRQDFNIENMNDMINMTRRFYIGDGTVKQTDLYPYLYDFVSDFKFNHPIQRCIVRYVNSGLQAFQYMFSYRGGRNYMQIRKNITVDGALHSDELGYLFDISFIREKPTPEDEIMIDRLTTMWANFIKFGNPTPNTSDLLPLTWVPATRDVMSYLDINSKLTMGTRPYHARSSFWDLFYTANQDNLLANTNYRAPSSCSRVSWSLVLILVCGIAMYILKI